MKNILKTFWPGPILYLLFVCIGVVALVKTEPQPEPLGPDVVMEVLDPSLGQYAGMWQKEVSRRFHHVVVILVHGGDFVRGQWIAGVSFGPQHVMLMRDVVREIQHEYPDRTVVLLACNTGHLHLNIPGVYYSHSSVWCIPDRSLTPEMMINGDDHLMLSDPFVFNAPKLDAVPRWESDPEVIGNIYEFSCD